MRLLFVAESLSYGGAARRFVGLANALALRNHQVEMLVYSDLIDIKDDINKRILIINDVIDYKPKDWLQRNIVYRVKAIGKINNTVNKNKYDVVISFNDMVNINLLLSRAKSKSKVLISERSDPHYNAGYLQKIKKQLYRYADGIVFQTEGAKSFFGDKLPKKIEIIPNPLPSNENFNKSKSNKQKKIVSVARLWLYQKRQDILLRAFKEFTKKHKNYELVLYGDGPDYSKIQSLIQELGISDKVSLAGAKDNIIERIKDAELFVLSSDFEGIPNALIEAMAVGLPVVSTRCSPGGAEFLITHKINGLLVERDNYKELAKAMLYMIENPTDASRMGDKAKGITDRLNEEKIYNKWEKFIYSL